MVAFDVLLRGGRVLDGTGAPARAADVGVTDGRGAARDAPLDTVRPTDCTDLSLCLTRFCEPLSALAG